MFVIVNLNLLIEQTYYDYLVLVFDQTAKEISIELPFTAKELDTKYKNKLPKTISGLEHEVCAKIMEMIINCKLIGPGRYLSYSGTPAVLCSLEDIAGNLYPLEQEFIFIHNAPTHIGFDEISSVIFTRTNDPEYFFKLTGISFSPITITITLK
ncbi:hypothetical protein PV327_008144 [Microctonus hyperodae]|uniref:FACT complex subunit SSRP1 n=1 Tax=Microctonus hyperodae TaxID=165561 RepID=A0AA39KGU0_MICHY|nr:hypothetical protein PV327_008144 [Microctonus hyperodae]